MKCRLMKYDIEFMKKVQKRMNLIPIIAKADHLTVGELKQFKQRVFKSLLSWNLKVLEDMKSNDILPFPYCIKNERIRNVLLKKLGFEVFVYINL